MTAQRELHYPWHRVADPDPAAKADAFQSIGAFPPDGETEFCVIWTHLETGARLVAWSLMVGDPHFTQARQMTVRLIPPSADGTDALDLTREIEAAGAEPQLALTSRETRGRAPFNEWTNGVIAAVDRALGITA